MPGIQIEQCAERERKKEFTLRFDLIRKQENGMEEDKEKKVKPIKKTHLLLYGITVCLNLGTTVFISWVP